MKKVKIYMDEYLIRTTGVEILIDDNKEYNSLSDFEELVLNELDISSSDVTEDMVKEQLSDKFKVKNVEIWEHEKNQDNNWESYVEDNVEWKEKNL